MTLEMGARVWLREPGLSVAAGALLALWEVQAEGVEVHADGARLVASRTLSPERAGNLAAYFPDVHLLAQMDPAAIHGRPV
jgi:hypothetical protein